MKRNGILSICLAFILLIGILCGCGGTDASSASPDTSAKKVSVTIVFEDKTEKGKTYKTDKEYLADLLYEEGFLKENEYKSGFYTYIDGVRADYNEDGAWWCIYENGKSVMAGMNELVIDDGDEFKIVYTPA